MPLDRREFLKHLSVGALSATCLSELTPSDGLAQEADNTLPIIDTHQHLWDLSKFQPPWLSGAPEILSKSYVTKDFLDATAGLNVVKAVYMEVDVAPSQQVEEAEHVIELSKSPGHPTVAAVISGRPNSTGFEKYIKQFKDSIYIKGVRQVLHTADAPQGLCLQQQFVASMRLLGELGMSFDLCMRPTELADGAKLAGLCPDTRFIVDHCGNADPKAWLPTPDEAPSHQVDQWKRDLSKIADCPNAICKISGIVARAPKATWDSDILAPPINFCLDTFGPDRVVFGGDWPVCLLGASYRRWVNSLKDVIANRSESEQRRLLHDNANDFYQLP
ncbi:MAG: amidohydrolase family protein [Planctomycetaceae bacterium]|nr:amidohydrolase family protein [Planctomycetales bacterium]MCB9921317.1 amidohydrolase family protein [Planctomycetaceae bacterium]